MEAKTVEPPLPQAYKEFDEKFAQACSQYRKAPNDIKKRAIYSETEKWAQQWVQQKKALEFKGWRGELVYLSARRDVAYADIRVGRFILDDWDGTRKGSTVYNQLAELSEGSCVIADFKIKEKIKAFSDWERSPCRHESNANVMECFKLCSPGLRVVFTSIKPCP